MIKERKADFSNDRYFLSNFYPSVILVEGISFSSVEQYYQWSKCATQQGKDLILYARTPGQMKRLGKQVIIKKDWEQIKEAVMYKGVKAKFSQNPELKALLLATGTEELAEGNNWGDTFWGVNYYTREGQNKLGKILMKVREEINNGKK